MNRLTFALLHPKLAVKWVKRGSAKFTEIDFKIINRCMKGNGVIVEAGSANGVDTLKLAKAFAPQLVFALEPINEQFLETKRITKKLNNVRVFNLALAIESGILEMYVGKSGPGLEGMGSSSILKPTGHLEHFPEIQFGVRERVTGISLEEFSRKNEIDFVDLLWLDLQGAEYEIIASAKRWIMQSVNLLHLEVSRVELYEGARLYREIKSMMKELNFEFVENRVGRISGNCLFQNKKYSD